MWPFSQLLPFSFDRRRDLLIKGPVKMVPISFCKLQPTRAAFYIVLAKGQELYKKCPRRSAPFKPFQYKYWIGLNEGYIDAEADIPLAEALGAICVQRFDDSRDSAIHITYRSSLRSSSLREPRYPLLRVVFLCMRLGPIHETLDI